MTISTAPIPLPYNGDGVTVNFSVTWNYFAKADVVATLRTGNTETLWILGTDYTLTTAGVESGGTLTATVAPASGTKLVIELDVSNTQQSALPLGGAFASTAVEKELDRMAQRSAELEAKIDRAMLVPTSDNIKGSDLNIPIDLVRAGKFHAYAADGKPTVSDGTGTDNTLRSDLASTVLSTNGDNLIGGKRTDVGAVAFTGHKFHEDRAWNIKTDVNALGDGISDETTLFITSVGIPTEIQIPAGTFILSQVSIPSNTVIKGFGSRTILKLKNVANSSFFLVNNASNITISDLVLDGNSANNLTGGIGVRVQGTSSNINIRNVEIKDFRISGFNFSGTGSDAQVIDCHVHDNILDGISSANMTQIVVSGCHVHNNGDSGIEIANLSHNSKAIGNIVHDNTGGNIKFVGIGSSLTDVQAVGNTCYNSTNSHGIQFNTVTRGVMVGNECYGNGLSGLDATLGSNFIVMTGNLCYNNTKRGIEVDSNSLFVTVTGNVVYKNCEEGVSVFRAPSTIIQGNHILENSTSSAGTFHGLRLWDTGLNLASANCRIIGNAIIDSRTVGKTQGFGISLENSASSTTIIGNQLSPNVTGAVNGGSGTNILRARDNLGWVTQNEGTGTIVSGTTSVVVNHGLDVTPVAADFILIPTNNPTIDPGTLYITTITATQFTVNSRVDPSTSGAAFSWRVSKW